MEPKLSYQRLEKREQVTPRQSRWLLDTLQDDFLLRPEWFTDR
jgi:hypothetical protein